MANFFGKPKASSARASPTQELDGAGPSTNQSEFERTFKPFVLKKDAEIAPINWFLRRKAAFSNDAKRAATPAGKELIIIDDNSPRTEEEIIDVDMENLRMMQPVHDVSQLRPKGLSLMHISDIHYVS